MRVLLALLCLCLSEAADIKDPNDVRIRLTAERGGPPLGAAFFPISVVNIPQLAQAPRPNFSRPLKGRPPPPPPPPPISSSRPTRPPRPLPPRPPVPPPSLPVPVPIVNSIPQAPMMPVSVPSLPPNIAIGQPQSNKSPALDTLPVRATPIVSTTPRDKDFLPAIYQRFQQNDDLSYFFDFQAENTIMRREQGFFKDVGSDQPILVKTGTYSYTSPEGYPFRVDYVADERGYRTYPGLL